MLGGIARRLDERQQLLIALSAAAVGWVLALQLLAASQAHVAFTLPVWLVPVLVGLLSLSVAVSLPLARVVVIAAAVAFVVVPAVRLADLRPETETANEAVALSEDAFAELRAGNNPYTADMTASVQRSGYPREPGYQKTGVAYPPLAWLAYPVLEAPSGLALGVADPRPLYGLLVVGLAWVLARWATTRPAMVWAAAASSSGLLAFAITEGTHDVLVVVLLVAALSQWSRPLRAALLIGVAAAVKTLVWPMLPVALIALSALRRDRLMPVAAALSLPLVLTAGPFLAWAPRATLRALLLTDDAAPSRPLSLREPLESLLGVDVAWPTRVLVVATACGVTVWAVRRGRASLPVVAGCLVLATAGVQLFSNVYHPYHLALPVALLVAAPLLTARGAGPTVAKPEARAVH